MLAAVVAQTPAGDTGGSGIFGLLLPLALAFLIFTMFRRQRRAQKQVTQMRTQLEPGAEVMTQFGLFGTIVSIDQENNRAVLELSPGTHATVNTQALSKVVQQEPTGEPTADHGTADHTTAGPGTAGPDDTAGSGVRRDLDSYDGLPVPDDASSIDDVGHRTGSGSTAAGVDDPRPETETPEQTMERLDRERRARDTRRPGGPAGTSDG